MRSLIFLILLSPLVFADEIELNIFSNGEVADADEVNENFNNLKNSIESIGSLQIISREQTVQDISVPSSFYNIIGVFDVEVLRGQVSCLANEVAISGGCRINNPNDVYLGEHKLDVNYTKDKTHYCSGKADQDAGLDMTIFVNCISQ